MKDLLLFVHLFPKYSHINASKDVRGIATIIAAAHVYFFAISELKQQLKP